MLKKETAADIWNCHRELKVSKELLEELREIKSNSDSKFDETAPNLRNAFGEKKHFQMGIPSGENSHRLFQVSPKLAESVIVGHIANKEAELIVLNEQAKIELKI